MITLKKNHQSDSEQTIYDVYLNGERQEYDAFAYPQGRAYWCDELNIEHCDTYAELIKEMNKVVK